MDELTNTQRYETLCQNISSWWSDRHRVGEALKEINENRLYKLEYDTFENFCLAKFGISKTSVYRLMGAVTMSQEVGVHLNGEQSAALKAAPEEVRQEIVAEVSGTGDLTSQKIREAVARRQEIPTINLDRTGYPIPSELYFDWERARETGRELTNAANDLRNAIKKGRTLDIVYKEVPQSAEADAGNLFTALKCIAPYAVCTSCSGRHPERCQLCRGKGFISKHLWETAVPEEIKALRVGHAAS